MTSPDTASRLRSTVSTVVRKRDRCATAGCSTTPTVASVIPHPRIEPPVDDVDEQVDHEEHEGDVEHCPLEDGEVAIADCQVGEAPDPRPGEEDLDDDHTSEQESELQTDDGHYGDPGVGEDVVPQDPPAAEPFGSGHARVVLVEGLENRRPHEPEDDRAGHEADCQRRQDQMRKPSQRS